MSSGTCRGLDAEPGAPENEVKPPGSYRGAAPNLKKTFFLPPQKQLHIHRRRPPRLWWGHSRRVNQPLPHTVPVSQSSSSSSSHAHCAPSTEPRTPDPEIEGVRMSLGCVRTSVSHVARNNETAFQEKHVCFVSLVWKKEEEKKKVTQCPVWLKQKCWSQPRETLH